MVAVFLYNVNIYIRCFCAQLISNTLKAAAGFMFSRVLVVGVGELHLRFPILKIITNMTK